MEDLFLDRSIEIIQSEEQKGKRMKSNEQFQTCETTTRISTYTYNENPMRREREGSRKNT